MRDYLLFRLYGPLASWGDIAVGNIRPSFRYPSKSGVIGLLAAALGAERGETEKQAELAKLLFSLRINAEGVPVDDYHTIQAPSEQAVKNDRAKDYWTRIDETEAIKLRIQKTKKSAEGGAIQSRRTYLCDAFSTVAFCEDAAHKISWPTLGISTLKDIVGKLLEPRFIPYLGRKACSLGLPMEPQIKTAANFKEAFKKAEFSNYNEISAILHKEAHTRYYSEECIEGSQMKLTRRDQPVNRQTWQFTDRDEYYFCE